MLPGGALLALIILAAAGALYQLIGARRDRARYAAPGRIVNIDGQRLHVICAGTGGPAVLFESGIAASSLSWTHVLRKVASFTHACAYDRAGLGWSGRAAGRLTAMRMLHFVRGVLRIAAPRGPYVLVGHSFGAFLACAYASRNRDEVAGLVLLDPPSEWHELTRQRAYLLRGGIQLSRIGGILARVGVVRACLALLTGGAPGVPRHFVRIFGPTAARTLERLVGEVQKLPPEVHPIVQALWCQPKCFQAMAHHLAALQETAAAADAVTSLWAVPLVVVSSGTQPPEVIEKHRQLARVSSQGRHIVAARSGHWIQFDEPDLVVTAIRETVDQVRHNTSAA
jgi:pimeloyl-ACP methyl ester carboxylesterase